MPVGGSANPYGGSGSANAGFRFFQSPISLNPDGTFPSDNPFYASSTGWGTDIATRRRNRSGRCTTAP